MLASGHLANRDEPSGSVAIIGPGMVHGTKDGLPVYINVGLTDSKRPDAQAGLESGVTLAMGAAAGADVFGHMGICGVDQAASLDILTLQNEIISFVESTMRTIDFSDEAIGLDVIEQTGSGGNFIDTMHTAEHFRKELWFPDLLDRDYYQGWMDAGAAGMEERCRRRKEEILAERQPEPLPRELEKTLDEIVTAAKRELSA